MNKIFRDGSYSIFSSFISLAVTLGTSIIIARLLGPEGKGIITLVVQIAALGSNIFTFGLSLSYQYYLGKKIISLEEVNGHILIQTLIIVGLMIIFILAGGENFLRVITQSSLSHNLLIIAVGMLILTTVGADVNGPLMALKDGVKLSSLYAIASTILYGFGIVLFTWILGWGVIGVLVANVISICLRIIFSWKKIFIRNFRTIKFNWSKLSKPLFIYGLSTMVGQFLLAGVLRIDTFIVNAYLGPGPLGVYSIAYTLAELLLLIPRGFGVAIFPQMNSASKEDQITMMATTARINLIFMSFGAVLLIIVGFPAIWIMFGAKFESAYAALLWILPGEIAMSLTYSSYHFFFASKGRPYVLAVIYGLGILINIGCNFILVPLIGINGASITSSITYILITLAFILKISSEEKLQIRKLIIPEREDFLILRVALMKFITRLHLVFN